MKETPSLFTSSNALPREGAAAPAVWQSQSRGPGLKGGPSLISASLAKLAGGVTPLSVERTRIKICGLTREEDVDAAIAAGADAVGFVMYEPSPRYITAERAAELASRLPPFVTPVLLFVNASATKIIADCARVPMAMVQFHGDETAEDCQSIGRPFMRAARIPLGEDAAHFDLVKYAETFKAAQAILLDAHVDGYGGGGKTFNWSLLPPNVSAHLVLSGGLTPANVIDGILQVRPRCKTLAVDVSSGVEVSKGIKSAEKISQFVAAVRAADQQLAARASRTFPAN